jgi:deoxyribodipyrimidine photo-lyase
VDVRTPLEAPGALAACPLDAGALPTLASLGLTEPMADPRELFRFRGGERAGRERLQQWMWEADRLRTYKTTRNGLLLTDDSSKLSAWLAHGCLSPRLVYAEVRRYERERVRNADTDWLVFELLWRDYFRLVLEKWGGRLFAPGGLNGLPYPWRRLDDEGARADFNQWTTGRTGFPLVDAAMRELAATGYTSNRARQNVASFLTRVLGIDWRLGASWFESLLVDYDVASNWGNWAYVAGVGNDARGFRFFNVLKQAREYDPRGDFATHWLSAEHDAYPPPMVDLFAAADASAITYERAVAKLPPVRAAVTRR